MKFLLLVIIKIYWVLVPTSKRGKCIFRKSCSQYVFSETKEKGLSKGIIALKFRYKNCRSEFEIFENPITGRTQMILPNQQIIDEADIAERFIKTKTK